MTSYQVFLENMGELVGVKQLVRVFSSFRLARLEGWKVAHALNPVHGASLSVNPKVVSSRQQRRDSRVKYTAQSPSL
jgi:hypothetical protein